MTTEPKKDMQTKNGRQLFLKQISPLKKKCPGQIRTQDLCHPRNISYLQAMSAGNAKKLEYIMKQSATREESRKVLWTKLITEKV